MDDQDRKFLALRLTPAQIKPGHYVISVKTDSNDEVTKPDWKFVRVKSVDLEAGVLTGHLNDRGELQTFTFAELGLVPGNGRCVIPYQYAPNVLERSRPEKSREEVLDRLNSGYKAYRPSDILMARA